jgi:hypothetical protein
MMIVRRPPPSLEDGLEDRDPVWSTITGTWDPRERERERSGGGITTISPGL